jgi:phosphatidate cytidylyltransferase
MLDAMPPLFGAVAFRVGALLAVGAGAILLLNVATASRRSTSPLYERQTRSRASLWPRFWVWVVGTSLLLIGAGAGYIGFGVLLALLSIQAAREVSEALRACRVNQPTLLVAIAAPIVVLSGARWTNWTSMAMPIAAIATVLAARVVVLIAQRGASGLVAATAGTLATLGYVAVPLAMLVGMLRERDGFALVSWLLIVIVLSDTFAMFGGLAFGRRQIASRISPGKTLEGVIAGFVGAVAGAAVMRFAFPQASPLMYYLAAFAVGVAGLIGDLLASALKRTAGLKDFSRFLPGHGGLMDRLDSILLGVPVLILLERLGAFR